MKKTVDKLQFLHGGNANSAVLTENQKNHILESAEPFFHEGLERLYIGDGVKSISELPYSEIRRDSVAIGHNVTSDQNSVSIGDECWSGAYGVAIGHNCQPSNDNDTVCSIRIGSNSYAIDNAIAVGVNVGANYQDSVVLGLNSSVIGSNSISIGMSVFANSDGVSIGNGSNSNGVHSISIGGGSNSNGESSISIGYKCKVNGERSIAIGKECVTLGDNGVIAIGDYVQQQVSGVNAIAIGTYITQFDGESVAIGHSAGAGAFSVAVGYGANSYSEDAVSIGCNAKASNGVSVGKNSNSVDSISIGENSISLVNSTAIGINAKANAWSISAGTLSKAYGYGSVAIGNGAEANQYGTVSIGIQAKTVGENSVQILSSGINAPTLKVGTKYATLVDSITSDARLKQNVTDADTSICLKDVNRLKVSRFEYKPFVEGIIDKHRTGWMADDVEKVFKNAVYRRDDTFPELNENGEKVYEEIELEDGTKQKVEKRFVIKDVQHLDMTTIGLPTLWGAVQELSKLVSNLQKEVDSLKEELNSRDSDVGDTQTIE